MVCGVDWMGLFFLVLVECLVVNQPIVGGLTVRMLKELACCSPFKIHVMSIIWLGKSSNNAIIIFYLLVVRISVWLGLNCCRLSHDLSLELTSLLRVSMFIGPWGCCWVFVLYHASFACAVNLWKHQIISSLGARFLSYIILSLCIS